MQGRLIDPPSGDNLDWFPFDNWEQEFSIAQSLSLNSIELVIDRKMSSNNPYALRANLLSQAEGILMQRYKMEHDRVREHVHLMSGNWDKTFDVRTVTWPTFPTTEDIIAEAEKLYSFVQKK